MAYVVFDDGLTRVMIRFIEVKPSGLFQYRRRVPEDLVTHFDGKRFFVRSLGRDVRALPEQAVRVSMELEADWRRLRGAPDRASARDIGSYQGGSYQVVQVGPVQVEAPPPPKAETLSMRQALALYLLHHPKSGREKFRTDAERVIGHLIAQLGDLPIEQYTRQQAEAFRDNLLATRMTGTARRYLNTVVALFNKVRREKQLQILNPFESLGIPGEDQDTRKREPFTVEELQRIAQACRRQDDDLRHIVALQLDTGARLGEIVGLRLDDVIIDGVVPHIHIRPFGEVRTLKTPASQRMIPLVGEALWAARRALQAREDAKPTNTWLFPRYASNRGILATLASATLNKWLRSVPGLPNHRSTHSFRHAMRDRFRAAEVPHDIQDALGGWGQRSVGQGYGRGYPLSVLQEHMAKVVLTARSDSS